MTESLPIPPPGFDHLPLDEQIEYVQSLWERISARPDRISVPDWHRAIVDDRLETYHRDPQEGSDWSEVKDRISKRIRMSDS